VIYQEPSAYDLLNSQPGQYLPLVGDSIAIDKNLSILTASIKAQNDDWSEVDIQYPRKYFYDWNDWIADRKIFIKKRYLGEPILSFMIDFIVDASIPLSRLFLYKNGSLISSTNYSIIDGQIYYNDLAIGDILALEVNPYQPSVKELEFDPIVKDPDPGVLTQYKVDYEYTEIPVRDVDGIIIGSKYYFWVKNRQVSSKGKISLKNSTLLLKHGPEVFMIIDGVKAADSNFPVRFTKANIVNIDRYAKDNNRYKLRFTKDYSMRVDSNGVDLKNKHVEWMLLNESSRKKVPYELWSSLVNTACATDSTGASLPSQRFVSYDNTHGNSYRYGFGSEQVLTDSGRAVSIIDFTIKNTTQTWISPSSGGINVPDTISYEGFDINNLSQNLSTPETTRAILNEIWEKAKANQVNEIFFNVLHDALEKTGELSGVFKTSLVSLHSIRLFNAA
jgi:hypothetical protein